MPPILLVTDRNLNVVGDPIVANDESGNAGWTTLDCTLRFNQPGSGMFVAPAHRHIREQIDAGNRIVVIRNQQVLIAGPIERYIREQSDDGENSGVGTLTVHFADDLAWVAGRVVYPNPALTPPDQMTDEWTFTGNAELAIRDLASLNAGPGALPARNVPRLVLGDLAGVGSSVTVSSGWEPLCEVMRRAGANGGGLGFRTRQVGDQIVFDVYQPVDRSAFLRFGRDLGNIRYLAYERVAPTATAAIVGGQGEGSGRFVTERTHAAGESAWGRLEVLVPRPGDDPLADLQQAGDDELAEASETARLQTNAYDSEDQRFGVDYGLGDLVTVQIDPGYEIADRVRLVHYQAWATAGELMSPMIGTQDASHDPEWIRRLRQIDRRLGSLERRAQPASMGG